MLAGKSVLHVNQDVGKYFSVVEIKGYYNNLTEKVLMEPDLINSKELPVLTIENNKTVYFPVGVFQYGLGAYDLYLKTKEEKYLKKFKQCAEWAIAKQKSNGAWSNFFYIYPKHPYGAMCQGEGASLLIRAYKQFEDPMFYDGAIKAIDFMLLPVEDGGTSQYFKDKLILLEYTHLPAVMNGWIFALFGLFDITLASKDYKYLEALKQTIDTLENSLSSFDNGYWSMYDQDSIISSPFYHRLHIAQLDALYQITQNESFEKYKIIFERYSSKKWNKYRAFLRKATQKIME